MSGEVEVNLEVVPRLKDIISVRLLSLRHWSSMQRGNQKDKKSRKPFTVNYLCENKGIPGKENCKNPSTLTEAVRKGVVMPRALSLLTLVLGVVFGSGNLLTASSGDNLDIASMTQKAEWVSEIEVLSKECVMLPDGSIETRLLVSNLTPMKGTMGSTEEIRIPGGEVAGRGMTLPGMPNFEVNERYIVFLTQKNEKQWRLPVDFSKGASRVTIKASGERVVLQGDHEGQVQVQRYDTYVKRINQAIR